MKINLKNGKNSKEKRIKYSCFNPNNHNKVKTPKADYSKTLITKKI